MIKFSFNLRLTLARKNKVWQIKTIILGPYHTNGSEKSHHVIFLNSKKKINVNNWMLVYTVYFNTKHWNNPMEPRFKSFVIISKNDYRDGICTRFNILI
jgi:hypothetical protein